MLGVHELLKDEGLHGAETIGALAMLATLAGAAPVTFLSYQQVAILSPMAFGLVIDGDDCLGTRLHP